MSWPSAVDYSTAVQNPSRCFGDADLAQARPVLGLFNAPLSYSGNFACVFHLEGRDRQNWAVKCFTRPVTNMQLRYAQISAHLGKNRKKFAVEFQYLPQGIQVGGQWYPIVKMDWVDGLRLNDFLNEHAGNASLLDQLCQLWLRLAGDLHKADMAHGDLQHGNVMLVEGNKAATMVLRLIDYDGMWVPALNGNPPEEVGHPNYQHPARLREGGYSGEVDRFAHLVIFTALRCLIAGGRPLWERHDKGENLLFSELDFREPAKSKLLSELLALSDANAAALVGHLVLASQGGLFEVPLLNELVNDGAVVPLAPQQLQRLGALIPEFRPRPVPASPRRSKVRPPSTAEVPALLGETVPLEPVRDPTPPEGVKAIPPLPRTPPPEPRRRESSELPPLPVRRRRRSSSGNGVIWALLMCGLVGLLLCGTAVTVWAVRSLGQRATVSSARLTVEATTVLRAGHKVQVPVTIDRGEKSATMSLTLAELPPGFQSDPVEVPSGSGRVELKLVLAAPLDAASDKVPLRVVLAQDGTKVEEAPVELTVRAFARPRLLDVGAIRLQPGQTQRLAFRVEANGNTDRWQVRLRGLPAGVSAKETVAPPGEAAVDLTAATGVANSKITITVELLADGLVADEKKVPLMIETVPAELRIGLIVADEVRLKTGERKKVSVELKRNGYSGKIRVEPDATRMPKGVKLLAVDVPEGQATVEVEVQATAELPEPLQMDLRSFRLVALVEGKPVGEVEGRLRLERKPTTAPPPTRTLSAPVAVRIPTGDGLRLHGTFYPVNDILDKPCVLMLHDPSGPHGRMEPSWVKLALALQKAGCAVLTFDFRGCGENRNEKDSVPPGFWVNAVNSTLFPQLRKKSGGIGPVTALDAGQFPSTYYPWLVQDVIAARVALDLQHDRANVNTSNLVVIGAGEGAALGMLWLATEARRLQKAEFGLPAGTESAVRDVVQAVWIDMANTQGRSPTPWTLATKLLQGQKLIPPMLLLHDKGTKQSVDRATFLAAALRKVKVTATPQGLEGKGLQGQALLGSRDAEGVVQEAVLSSIRKHTRRAWAGGRAARQVWAVPGRSPVQVIRYGDKIELPGLFPLDAFGYRGPTAGGR